MTPRSRRLEAVPPVTQDLPFPDPATLDDAAPDPTPPDGAASSRRVRAQVPDALPAPIFDHIARLAVRTLELQLVTISFVDDGERWFRSMAGPLAGSGGVDHPSPFCAHALLHADAPLIVEDAVADPRFRDIPLVAGPSGIRFYAGVPLRNGDGQVVGILSALDTRLRPSAPHDLLTLLDLAAAVTAMLELRRGAEADLHAHELNPHCPWIADSQGRLLQVSPRIAALTGMTMAEVLAEGWIRAVHPDDVAEVQDCWAASLRTGVIFDRDYRIRLADDGYRWFHGHAEPRHNLAGGIDCWYGIVEDIDDRKTSQARIEHLAYRDELTGLANRAQFRRMLEQQIAWADRGVSFALLRLDLDDFKAINDTLGHRVGDMLLTQVAARLGDCVRQTDIVARDGDDEFFVLQTHLGEPEDAVLLVERILAVLSTPMKLDGVVLSIGASIGITLCPQDGALPDKLLQNSDLALGRAKQEARGSYRFFEPDMDERLRIRQALKVELRDALDRGEFELAYQPLIGLPGGRIDGFEALLRWRHPTRGFVSPAEFIPAAENTGLILPIGRWVLERACRDAATWPDGIHVAVNLSAMQFRQGVLPQVVARALGSSGLDPQRLELEITETVPLLDDESSLVMLRRLRGLGVRIVLDDFGTGYASLAYLTRFAFDKLKIDRSFVARMTDTPDTQTIVNAVLRMSHALGIAITAEGVETREQLDILVREGCNELQGFFFSRAVPLAAVPDLLAHHERRRLQEDWCGAMIAT